MFDELEITCSANWRIRSANWRFGEMWSATTLVELVMKWHKNPVIVSGDLNHSGEKMEKNLRRFGENVFGDLEKTCLAKMLEI